MCSSDLDADGFDQVRVDFYLRAHKDNDMFIMSFYIKNKPKKDRSGSKFLFINTVAQSQYATDESMVGKVTASRPLRIAKEGELELHEFLRYYLSGMDFKSDDAELMIDVKKLFKGDYSELKDLVGMAATKKILCLATIKTKADGTEVQEVFNKAFYYENGLAQIRNTDYTKPEVIRSISLKGDKERSLLEKFINKIAGEYGCKHYYKLCEYTDYDPSSNVVSSNSVLVEDDPIF